MVDPGEALLGERFLVVADHVLQRAEHGGVMLGQRVVLEAVQGVDIDAPAAQRRHQQAQPRVRLDLAQRTRPLLRVHQLQEHTIETLTGHEVEQARAPLGVIEQFRGVPDPGCFAEPAPAPAATLRQRRRQPQ